MSDYISIGNLATDLKTSKQKLGQVIDYLEIERKRVRQGKWYNMCVALEDVDKVMAVVKDFKVDQTGTKVQPKRKKENVLLAIGMGQEYLGGWQVKDD